MNDFIYSYPTKVYFGDKAAAKALPAELEKAGKTVMLAYGGGSIKKNGVYFILAVGGGSVIDCCKIIAAQAVTGQDIWEMEFKNHVYPTMFIPMGAIVTASGTGAEMNNGAIITNEETKEKAGVLGAHADFAVLDAAYTMSLPAKQVISGAFDTLSHSMETYLGSPRKITLSDEIAEARLPSSLTEMGITAKDVLKKVADTCNLTAEAMPHLTSYCFVSRI